MGPDTGWFVGGTDGFTTGILVGLRDDSEVGFELGVIDGDIGSLVETTVGPSECTADGVIVELIVGRATASVRLPWVRVSYAIFQPRESRKAFGRIWVIISFSVFGNGTPWRLR